MLITLKNGQKEFENEVHFHQLCFNTGYLDVLCKQIEEVMAKYNPCGIFLDIISPKICYCEKCKRTMSAGEFYSSNNLEKYPNEGKFPKCKKCMIYFKLFFFDKLHVQHAEYH